eukprot:19300-Eustigmatos_ZCMA.PRE.1
MQLDLGAHVSTFAGVKVEMRANTRVYEQPKVKLLQHMCNHFILHRAALSTGVLHIPTYSRSVRGAPTTLYS